MTGSFTLHANPPAKDVLTTQEAALLLGVSASSVQKMVGRGELPGWTTPGGHRRIPRQAVEALLGQAPGQPMSVAPAPGRELLQILVAEDDPFHVELVRRVLEAHEARTELILVTDASQALIQLERHRPHLLLTDLVMQPFDGFQLLRTIMAEPAWRDLEVLCISGLGADEVAARGGLPPGCTLWPKPFAVARFMGYIDSVWARHQARLHRPVA